MKIFKFYLGEKKYGLSIDKIIMIEKNNRELVSIPGASEILCGVVNVRSKLCPVIDLKLVVDGSKNDITADKKLILFNLDDKRNGALLVDDTDNIVEISEDIIETFESNGNQQKIVNNGEEIFILIDIEDFESLLPTIE